MSSGESSALREAIPLKRWRTALMSDELYERVEFLEGLAAGLALSPGKPAPNCPSCRLDAARKAEQVGGDAALREVLSELTQIVRDGPSLEEFRRNDRYHQAYFYLASKVLAAIPGGDVRCTATGVEEGRPSQQCCLVQGHTLPHDFTPTVRLSAFVEEMKRVAPAEGGDVALREALEPFGAYLTILEAHCHLAKLGPLDDKDTILHFMGSGADCRVTVKQLRDLLALSAHPEQEELNAKTVLQYPPDGIPAQGDDDG
ncbi:hypothetical protein LCGC14_2174440 [marine sediment metagenome]|uniref:Uncharacterized protein n=1 Tax=marine sediment metagenome TaxID=412755 RepID=A0A0F9DP55_9ZZZZ